MISVMRKPVFCMCENKAADQLLGNRAADQCLCFCYIDSTTPHFFNPKYKPLAIFWCVLDLVGNSEDRFSRDAAHILYYLQEI